MMDRLSKDALKQIPSSIATPKYDRYKHGTGIVHLGVGAFHRAHQAAYTEAALTEDGGDWRILGASLSSSKAADQLKPQDCLYTLVEKSPTGPVFQVIGALANIVQANQEPQTLISAIAAPKTRIVSMTVTEKGYGYDTGTGTGNFDLNHPNPPWSTIGFLVAGLKARRQAGQGGLSLISCDNIPSNGVLLRKLTTQYAEQIDPDLAEWISHEISFPSTMVDRITPATTEDDLAEVASCIGFNDRGAVVCEPFSQWIIEDRFVQGRPAWEAGGAEFVSDVTPYEKIKLRLLNGSHSFLAYLGCLTGITDIHEIMSHSLYREATIQLMAEVGETLDAPAGFNLTAYQQQLLDRFDNPSIQHKATQIAMDGSKKLPQRLLEPCQDRIENGLPVDSIAVAIACWMRFVMVGAVDQIVDPMATDLLKIRKRFANNSDGFTDAILHESSIFPPHLGDNEQFSLSVKKYFTKLCHQGVDRTLRDLLNSKGS